jgi:hypothetical protein
MIVISDTSPLNYLILIGYQDVLPEATGKNPFDIEKCLAPDLVRRARFDKFR